MEPTSSRRLDLARSSRCPEYLGVPLVPPPMRRLAALVLIASLALPSATASAQEDPTAAGEPAPPEAPVDTTGWAWFGALTGLGLGVGALNLGVAYGFHEAPPGMELTGAQIGENVGTVLGGVALTAGLTALGLLGLPALAEAGAWSEDVGYGLALSETLAFAGAGLGVSAAATAGGGADELLAAGLITGASLGVLGAVLAAALDDDRVSREDRRLFPLLGTAFGVLATLVAWLVAGAAQLENAADEVFLIGTSTTVAGILGMSAIAATR